MPGSSNETITAIKKILDEYSDIFISVACIILFICIIVYIIENVNFIDNKCNKLNSFYKDKPALSSIKYNQTAMENDIYLRDFYIKSAYNCCSLDSFKNSYLDICILKDIINQGVRFLDFQIFSYDNRPVISTNTILCDKDEPEPLCYKIKQTFNVIEFNKVIQIIKNYAFSFNECPNPTDPIILHFRIMSNNLKIYDAMADTIKYELNNVILPKNYGYDSCENIGKLKIRDCMNKVIIIVDNNNTTYKETSLYEYVNASSGGSNGSVKLYKYDDIYNEIDTTQLIAINKQYLSIVIPNTSITKYTNMDFNVTNNLGIQFTAMSYQFVDTNLLYYNDFFTENKYALVLKPSDLRLILDTYYFEPEEINSGYETAGTSQFMSTCTLQYQPTPVQLDTSNNCIDSSGTILLTQACFEAGGVSMDASGYCYDSSGEQISLT